MRKDKIFVKYATIIYFCPAAEAEGARGKRIKVSASWRIN
jgi:hypothetical protein